MFPKWFRLAFWLFILTFFIFLAGTVPTHAQAVRFDGVVQQRSGLPGPGVTIAVCTQPAITTTAPCSPLATLFTSTSGLTSCSGTLLPPGPPGAICSNPMISDGLGNYHFYVTPGQVYTLQFYGPGITPFIIPDQQVAASGNILPATIAIKPKINDNICYVSGSNGLDSNDGLSIGSAKLTVYSCLTTGLPGGTATTAGNGTVLIAGSASYGGPVTNQGMWLMGPNDPNYGSPPFGWLKNNGIGPLTITLDCFATYTSASNGHTGHCQMNGGSNGSPNLPSIWISAVAGNITLNNIIFQNYVGNFIRYGIDSTGNRNGTGGSSGFAMRNVAMNNGLCNNSATQTGPAIDIGSQSFWIWLKENTLPGCQAKIFAVAPGGAVRLNGLTTITTTTNHDLTTNEAITIANVTDDSFNGSFGGLPGLGNNNFNSVVTVIDSTHFTYTNPGPNTTSGTGQVITARSAAINMDSGNTGTGTGLIFIDDTNLNGGNIRYRQGTSSGSFYVRNVSYEGNFVSPDAPVVLIMGTEATSNGDSTSIKIENIEIADPANLLPGVQVDNPAGPFSDLVIVSRVQGFVRGKMTVLGNASISSSVSDNATFLRKQQYGLRNGQIIATGIDNARRGFSPVVAKGTNIATTSPGSWTFSTGTGTITSGIAAPDGTNNAGRVAYTSGSPQAVVQFFSSGAALNIGDIYIVGAWVRSFTANGYAGGVAPIKFVLNNGGGNGDVCAGFQGFPPSSSANILGNAAGSVQSDGQWQWYSGVCKIAANPTAPGTLFGGLVDASHTVEFYAPTLLLISSGSISDNESYEIAANFSPWDPAAAAGDVSMLPGQLFRPGSRTFANLGTPGNGVVVYCPDCTIANPCAGAGTGAMAKRLNGVWVCN